MKNIISFFIISGSLLIISSCNNSSSGNSSPQSYEEKKVSLEDQEKSMPTNFLTSTGTYRPTLFGNKMVIDGTVTNKATLAIYKDVVLTVSFYSKTNTKIDSKNYVIYDFFPPNQTKPFNMKIEVPGATNSLGWSVKSASVK